MLIKLDKLSKGVPSRIINIVTCGPRGSSMCARLYLYQRYVSRRNLLVNGVKGLVDFVESDHCHISAKIWRKRVRMGTARYPREYRDFFCVNMY